MKKIAFAGTDGRTLLSALVTATATSDIYDETFEGVVVRGTPSMPKFSEIMNWPVEFIATASNSVEDYKAAIIAALTEQKIDYVIPMPEALLFEGLVDAVEQAGFAEHIIGLRKNHIMKLGFRSGVLRPFVIGYTSPGSYQIMKQQNLYLQLAEIYSKSLRYNILYYFI